MKFKRGDKAKTVSKLDNDVYTIHDVDSEWCKIYYSGELIWVHEGFLVKIEDEVKHYLSAEETDDILDDVTNGELVSKEGIEKMQRYSETQKPEQDNNENN